MLDLAMLKAQEVLVRYSDDFHKDFDFEDVQEDLSNAVLTNDECTDILELTNDRTKQIDRLMFSLSTSAHKVIDFINAIGHKYPWLAQRMRAALSDVSKDNELETIVAQIHELRGQIPRLEAFNVPRKRYLFEIQQKLKELRAGECLMLTGDLVYGKKWLAIDSCSNYEIMEHMGSRIYLVNLDKCQTHEEILDRMLILNNMLDPSDISSPPDDFGESSVNKIYFLRDNLRRKLLAKHPDALLVLCDVQSTLALDAFKLQRKCMLTTRNKEILDEWPSHLRHDIPIKCGFTPAESRSLFARVLGTAESALPTEAQSIHERCGGSPFIVSLVASNLRDYTMTDQRWRKWVHMLDKNESSHYDSFRSIIQQSLSVLSDAHKQLFYSLAIFGDNVKIPLALLQSYWQKSETDVEQIVRKFDRLYLVETVSLPPTTTTTMTTMRDETAPEVQMFCLLKYHYCSYLSHRLTDAAGQEMHRKLIQSYGVHRITDFRDVQRLDDRYFYFYIGHHLSKANQLPELGRLYLNLSFLEQKLRATGLPNTIGDLLHYRHHIIDESADRRALFNDLRKFLPNVEEMLKKSSDTTLLQYALNTTGALQAEAARQVDDLPDRVFFRGSMDHINRHRRQIVALPHRPTFIRFWGPNTALIAFENHSIYLVDLSPGYTVQPSLFGGHAAAIVDIQMLGASEFASLDAAGVCHVWSLQSTPIHRRRSSSHGASSSSSEASHGHPLRTGAVWSSSVRQNRADSFDKHAHRHTPAATIVARSVQDSIRCMAVERRPDVGGSTVRAVLFGTRRGQLLRYEWSGTELEYDLELSTTFGDIRAMRPSAQQMMFVLSATGALWLYNAKTSAAYSLLAAVDYEHHAHAVEVIALHTLSEQSYAATVKRSASDFQAVVVFGDRVLRVHVETNVSSGAVTNVLPTPVYLIGASAVEYSRITCSVMSADRRYLVLGTERGLVVLDVRRDADGEEVADTVLRGRVSDPIACVDIHSLNGERFKYLLMCGTAAAVGEQLSYLYALESDRRGALMQWAQLDPWLKGGRLFGVITDTANDAADHDEFKLVALDSNGVLQCRCAEDDFAEVTRVVCGQQFGATTKSPVLRLSCHGDYVVTGCADGTVNDNRKCVLMQLASGPVTFLRCFGDRLVVAGSPSSYRIGVLPVEMPSTQVRQCFVAANGACLVVVKDTAAFDVFDLDSDDFVPCNDQQLAAQMKLGGCDLVDDYLVIATTHELHVWRVERNDAGAIAVRRRPEMHLGRLHADTPVTCVALSAQREFVAVGFRSGSIHLYRLAANRTQFIQALHSHRTAVQALLFAPWPSQGGDQPLVLASVAAELCFWNCTYAVNNPAVPLAAESRRLHSDRFPDQPSPVTPDEDDHHLFGGARSAHVLGPWSGKMGDQRKPCLLACIKFNGRVAEQLFANAAFTKFLTIDDSGEIYHFTIRGWVPPPLMQHETISSTNSRHKSSSSSSLEDDVIAVDSPSALVASSSASHRPVVYQFSPLNGHLT